jgi:4-amino-4-deoxychorismate lyase
MVTTLAHNKDDDFHIFTTFRLDDTLLSDAAHIAVCGGHKSDVYLLPYHFDRLKTAAAMIKNFQCPDAMSDLKSFERKIHEAIKDSKSGDPSTQPDPDDAPKQTPVTRGKISWWPNGHLEILLVPVPQTFPTLLPASFNNHPAPSWTVTLDDQPTLTSLYLEIKTSYRKEYDRARKSAGLEPKSTKEVLLYNDNSEIVDGSITTVYFYREGKWVTPRAGGLEGTTRRFALENELCVMAESAVRVESLRDGEIVWLSNAFRGFFAATFCVR